MPASVPRQRESEWKGTFVPPMRTFFTVPENYDFQKSGGATIAAGGLRSIQPGRTASPAGRIRCCRPA